MPRGDCIELRFNDTIANILEDVIQADDGSSNGTMNVTVNVSHPAPFWLNICYLRASKGLRHRRNVGCTDEDCNVDWFDKLHTLWVYSNHEMDLLAECERQRGSHHDSNSFITVSAPSIMFFHDEVVIELDGDLHCGDALVVLPVQTRDVPRPDCSQASWADAVRLYAFSRTQAVPVRGVIPTFPWNFMICFGKMASPDLRFHVMDGSRIQMLAPCSKGQFEHDAGVTCFNGISGALAQAAD